MKISENISDKEIKELQHTLYEYFDTGYHFEEFLKEYLLKMGLDEVEITQRSRDGGVDLKAIRQGVGDFSDIDIINYYVQAKCYKLSSKINVSKIRELKGTIPFGYKGIYITTSSFTKDAKEEAVNDPSKPVVLVDGEALLRSCIDNQIGFVYLPKFSKKEMDKFLNKKDKTILNSYKNIDVDIIYIDKTITANDIRARIISCPTSIMNKIHDKKKIEVIVNDEKKYKFSVSESSRNFLSSVTQFFKDYNLLTEDGIITPKLSKWHYDEKKGNIRMYIGKENG